MSFVATLQKDLPMGRRKFFSSGHKLLWLALVLSISLCHQAAFASALSQLAASLQPGQFAELTGMNGFNNGNILIPRVVVQLETIVPNTPTKLFGILLQNSFNSWVLRMETVHQLVIYNESFQCVVRRAATDG